MATENLVPAYLAEIYNRAIPSPVSANSPFQGFSAPIDDVSTSDTVTATTAGPGPFLYGSTFKYGAATYGNH